MYTKKKFEKNAFQKIDEKQKKLDFFFICKKMHFLLKYKPKIIFFLKKYLHSNKKIISS